jgi:hypothetical protein
LLSLKDEESENLLHSRILRGEQEGEAASFPLSSDILVRLDYQKGAQSTFTLDA